MVRWFLTAQGKGSVGTSHDFVERIFAGGSGGGGWSQSFRRSSLGRGRDWFLVVAEALRGAGMPLPLLGLAENVAGGRIELPTKGL